MQINMNSQPGLTDHLNLLEYRLLSRGYELHQLEPTFDGLPSGIRVQDYLMQTMASTENRQELRLVSKEPIILNVKPYFYYFDVNVDQDHGFGIYAMEIQRVNMIPRVLPLQNLQQIPLLRDLPGIMQPETKESQRMSTRRLHKR